MIGKIIKHQTLMRLFQLGYKSGIIKKRPLIDSKASIQRDYFGGNILSAESGNDICKKILLSEKPCMLGRIGTVEMGILNAYLLKKAGIIKSLKGERSRLLCNNAGFFPNEEEYLEKFCELYIQSAEQLDMMGVFCQHSEDLFHHLYAKESLMAQFTMYEPFYFNHPWSKALEGKKVLVIHPFENSILKQYNRREELFENIEVLPKFDLITLKAIQTIGDDTQGFEDWFNALDYMIAKINTIDFDIALVGCGAYAFPIAAHIKRMGKKSVITAGATQLLFGIKGKRWDHAETPVPYRESWIRPSEQEIPKKANSVENGCYW